MNIRIILAVSILGLTSIAHADGFARHSDAYCTDMARTAQKAAEFRDAGHPFSVARARDGWTPNPHLPDFDLAANRVDVSKQIYASHLNGSDAYKLVFKSCKAGE
jgi:hypothetical protein